MISPPKGNSKVFSETPRILKLVYRTDSIKSLALRPHYMAFDIAFPTAAQSTCTHFLFAYALITPIWLGKVQGVLKHSLKQSE